MAGVAQRDSGRLLTGWGRTTRSRAKVAGPLPEGQPRALVGARPAGGVLARGAGRSYRYAARNAGGVVVNPVTAPRVDLVPGTATVRVSAFRVYLAGDSGLSGRGCAAMYSGLAQWRAAATRSGPAGVFRSDPGQRLGLRRAGATSPGRQHAG